MYSPTDAVIANAVMFYAIKHQGRDCLDFEKRRWGSGCRLSSGCSYECQGYHIHPENLKRGQRCIEDFRDYYCLGIKITTEDRQKIIL